MMTSDAPATEISLLTLRAGVDVGDASSAAHQTFRDAVSIIATQHGFQHAYYGHVLEDHSTLQLVVDWDSIESHMLFKASPEYAPFKEKLSILLSQPPKLFHFIPKPFPPTILGSAPCIEIATFFQTELDFLGNVERFICCLEGADGCFGHSFGKVVEEIEKEPGAEIGKAVLLCIGWESKEMHMRFRETDSFKNNIHLLRKGSGAAEMHHVSFKTFR